MAGFLLATGIRMPFSFSPRLCEQEEATLAASATRSARSAGIRHQDDANLFTPLNAPCHRLSTTGASIDQVECRLILMSTHLLSWPLGAGPIFSPLIFLTMLWASFQLCSSRTPIIFFSNTKYSPHSPLRIRFSCSASFTVGGDGTFQGSDFIRSGLLFSRILRFFLGSSGRPVSLFLGSRGTSGP